VKVVRGREKSRRTERGRTGHFSGRVWLEPMLEGEGSRSNYVVFEPEARTYWHRHSGDQVLYVVAGEGGVENSTADTAMIRPGDVVHIRAGEKHWHGAAPSCLMAHIAMTMGASEWLDQVSGSDYAL
jgi:quercetin dioxygenase-like cupin family protein